MKFGVQIPQEGTQVSAIFEHARAAEALGYDTAFIPDHLIAVAVKPGGSSFECWTIVTGMLLETKRIRGGPLVLSEAFRNPAWLANASATLDRMSGGRLILGLGAGWYEAEYRAYGFDWREGPERVVRLAEACEVIMRFWGKNGEGFDGRYHKAAGTKDSTMPHQKPHPPLWIGGRGPKLLEVAARYATAWNAPVLPVDSLAEKAQWLKERRPDIEITYEGPVWIDADEERIQGRVEKNRNSENPVARRYAEVAVAGTPEQIVKRIQEYADAGVTHFVCHFGKTHELAGTELFAKTVMPAFSGKRDAQA